MHGSVIEVHTDIGKKTKKYYFTEYWVYSVSEAQKGQEAGRLSERWTKPTVCVCECVCEGQTWGGVQNWKPGFNIALM